MTGDGATFTTNGVSDFVVSNRTPTSDPIWFWQAGSPEQDWCWGVATDAQNAIWVGSSSADLEFGEREIVISRTAP